MESAHPAAVKSRNWRFANAEAARSYGRDWFKRKYATDADYREAQRQRKSTPAAREVSRQRAAAKRADPETRERLNSYQAERNRQIRRDPKRWAVGAISTIRRRAAELNVPCNITAEDIIVPEKCPVFGVPFVFGARHKYGPSVDRICPALGYVKGNVRVISRRANQIKTDADTAAEVQAVADYMRREGL